MRWVQERETRREAIQSVENQNDVSDLFHILFLHSKNTRADWVYCPQEMLHKSDLGLKAEHD